MPDMCENAIKENDVGKVYKLISGTNKIPIGLRNKASQSGKGLFSKFFVEGGKI